MHLDIVASANRPTLDLMRKYFDGNNYESVLLKSKACGDLHRYLENVFGIQILLIDIVE